MSVEFKTPRSLLDAYKNGFIGSICDPEDVDKLLGELPHPLFGAAAYDLVGSGEGKVALLYKNVQKFDPGFGPSERQTTGDCFLAGSKVRMADGSLKNIEQIKIGEYVISGFGNKKMVTNIFHKPYDGNSRPLVRLTTNEYSRNLIATPDHKILTENGIEKAIIDLEDGDQILMPSINSIDNNIVFDMSEFCETEYIDEKTDHKSLRLEPVKTGYIRAKNGRHSIKKYITMSEKLAWLVGLYAAEGSNDGVLRNERITYNLGSHEAIMAHKVKQYFKDVFDIDAKIYQVPSKPSVIYVRIHNIMIAKFFKYLCKGNTYSKKLSKEWFVSPISCQIAMVSGWFDGDGNKQYTQGTTVSRDLVLDMVDILNNIGIESKITEREAYFDGISNHVKSYICCLNKKNSQKLLSQTIDIIGLSNNFGRYTTVKSIEVLNQDINTIYCIEVEDDHNFICNGYGVNNCVSHSTRNAIDVTRSTEIIGGEREEWVARSATEAIYGSRGHGGQGMSCSGAARFVHQSGGVLLRKDYGFVDLSRYNGGLGAGWGRRGVPSDVVAEAKKHQVKTISNIRTVEEARDAIANGYAISVCSGYGFSSRRDKNGIAKKSGGWSHAMAWVAMDDSREIFNETLFLVQNSWGVWNGGPKRLDQPDGSFWIREGDARGMLSGGGAWVLSDVDGFPPRKVDWTLDEVF
jgi:intein/homing endonuclease